MLWAQGPWPPLMAPGWPIEGLTTGLACLVLGPHGKVGRAGGERCLESGPRDHTSPKFDIDMLVSLLKQEKTVM